MVISGDKAAVEEEGATLAAKGFRVVPLKVSGAFHTPLMATAGNAFSGQVERHAAAFKPSGHTEVYSNVTGDLTYASGAGDSVATLQSPSPGRCSG